MIPKNCKRLAEVDFPVAVVSAHAAREKSIRHGHPSTLHLWWARRPLASCRAMLLAILLPDPDDDNCPPQFKNSARNILAKLRTPAFNPKKSDDCALREILLHFIGEFANWDNANNSKYIDAARQLVQAAHGEDKPLVADSFSGGGSIPLEALRIGCDAFASDLNPVACLILRAMLEEIPRRGLELADQLRQLGEQVKKQAEYKLAPLYPKDSDGAIPIAYLWARTVQCESPNCGAEIPLMRSFWLANKTNRQIALRPVISKNGKTPRVDFEIFQPKSNESICSRTVERAKATCLCCESVLPAARVRAQLAGQRGGANVAFDKSGKRIGGARMLAVVNSIPETSGRFYRLPNDSDYAAVNLAEKRISKILSEWEKGGKKGLCPAPDELLPKERQKGNSGIRLIPYGLSTFGDLFSSRQKMALLELMDATRSTSSDALELLALIFSRMVNGGSSFSRWHNARETHEGLFSRQAIGMVWDFSEVNPLSSTTGGYEGAVEWVEKVAKAFPKSDSGVVQQADARNHPLSDAAVDAWFTDPPYYDAIAYADLSDFFLVWLKRALRGHLISPDPFDKSNRLSPKLREAIQDPHRKTEDGRAKDANFYDKAMGEAFAEGRRILRDSGIASVVFAHKTTEGWESLISGLIRGGWTITASWPVATEMGQRVNARGTAHLATSVHLVCRPRPADAQVGEWADVLKGLPIRVGDWMEHLQNEGVHGADLIFACIGPALEVFSRYSQVEKPDGTAVNLPEYLKQVWEVVARTALEQILGTEEAKARNGAAGAVEEDARLTALFLWTMRSTKDMSGEEEQESEEDEGKAKTIAMSLPYDVVRRFAQPLGINLDEWEERVVKTDNGVVSLLPISSRSRSLLGENIKTSAAQIHRISEPGQVLFGEEESDNHPVKGRKVAAKLAKSAEADFRGRTTLDRVHMAMLLHKNGQSAALRDLVRRENERGPHFLRLVNSLAGLYPRGGEELRLVEGVALYAK